MRTLILSCVLTLVAGATISSAASADESSAEPLDILLVTSGCCHDYDFQTKAMQLAFKARGVDTNWTVVSEGGKTTSARISLYDNTDWAGNFDVVIHNECFAKTSDADYIRRITKPHFDGTPAVVIHCAMHTYRDATIDDWREMLGVTSRRHEHKSRYPIKVVAADHPIMAGFPRDHVSEIDELYVIEKLWPNASPLATSVSEKTGQSHPVFWTNRYGKARVFGTTYGHSSETFTDQVFLNAIVRGTRWAAGRL